MEHRRNSFDCLRLLGALLVIFGHAGPLTGRPAWALGQYQINGIGVSMFFYMSGFLITQSWARDPDPLQFAKKRALRIMPALAAVTLLTALFIGPLLTTVPLSEYFASAQLRRFISLNLVLRPQYQLPGVFKTNVHSDTVNGSIWTLPLEVMMYALTPLFVLATARTRRAGAVLLTALALFLTYVMIRAPWRIDYSPYGIPIARLATNISCFMLGAVFARLDMQNWSARRARVAVGTSLVVFAAALLMGGRYQVVLGLIPLGIVVLYAGLSRVFAFGWLDRVGDLSYGVYLWGWLAQQIVVSRIGAGGGPLQNALFALVIVVPLAWLSWHYVETPFLRFKSGRRQPVIPSFALPRPSEGA